MTRSDRTRAITAAATLLAGVALLATQAKAAGERECHVKILHELKDDVGNTWQPGQILPVDIARDTATGGSFCAHGGSCVPRRIDNASAARLTDCRIGPSIGGDDHSLSFNLATERQR